VLGQTDGSRSHCIEWSDGSGLAEVIPNIGRLLTLSTERGRLFVCLFVCLSYKLPQWASCHNLVINSFLKSQQTVHQLINKSPALYGTRRFITVFTKALHLSLYTARPIQSTPYQPIPLRSILVLSSHLLDSLRYNKY
jgi:hypothetical protein